MHINIKFKNLLALQCYIELYSRNYCIISGTCQFCGEHNALAAAVTSTRVSISHVEHVCADARGGETLAWR